VETTPDRSPRKQSSGQVSKDSPPPLPTMPPSKLRDDSEAEQVLSSRDYETTNLTPSLCESEEEFYEELPDHNIIVLDDSEVNIFQTKQQPEKVCYSNGC
jgi:hypothetical protein